MRCHRKQLNYGCIVNNSETTFIQGTGIKLVADDMIRSTHSLLFMTSHFKKKGHSLFFLGFRILFLTLLPSILMLRFISISFICEKKFRISPVLAKSDAK